jgi:hypothetical protein
VYKYCARVPPAASASGQGYVVAALAPLFAPIITTLCALVRETVVAVQSNISRPLHNAVLN